MVFKQVKNMFKKLASFSFMCNLFLVFIKHLNSNKEICCKQIIDTTTLINYVLYSCFRIFATDCSYFSNQKIVIL